jgi:transposase
MERKGVSFYYFRRKPIKLGNRYERWRGVADLLKLKAQERLRIEWMIFYWKEAKENATKTCRHFSISRKTFYKWFNRFKESKEDVKSLKDISRRPHKVRTWEVSLLEEARIRQLRKKYMYYGKRKLKVLYKKAHNEDISCWKIERVIRRYKLYPDKVRQAGIARKQARSREKPKRRIIQLKKENRLWFLFQIDTIVIYWGNLKRYIITALDHTSKLGYARMYKTKSSKVTADFLYRLKYLIQQPIENIQTDNGSEFAYYFEKATDKLNIKILF